MVWPCLGGFLGCAGVHLILTEVEEVNALRASLDPEYLPGDVLARLLSGDAIGCEKKRRAQEQERHAASRTCFDSRKNARRTL